MENLIINGVEYAPVKTDEMPYKMVRGDRSGVFAGYLESENGNTVVLRDARRIWYWDGAASLSQLSQSGTSKPQNCKFPETMCCVKIFDVVEMIDITDRAKASIESVPVWTA